MSKVCKKCGYQREEFDKAPEDECPQCGAIYSKVEIYLKKKQLKEEELRQKQLEEALRNKQLEEEEEELRQKYLESVKVENERKEKRKQLKGKSICSECGTLGKPIKLTKGSIVIEIFLWVMFIIPGLIYSLWRHTSRYMACPKCKHESMIPADSPKGMKLISELEN